MKTTTALPVSALAHKPRVKIYLIKGIICLTSKNFCIFASIAAALMEYVGVLLDDNYIIAYGAIIFLIGFTPWAMRETARDIRQDKLGINNDKW